MERTQNAMKLCDLEKTRKYEKTREIKRFFKRSFPNAKTISSQPRYDHFDISAYSIIRNNTPNARDRIRSRAFYYTISILLLQDIF